MTWPNRKEPTMTAWLPRGIALLLLVLPFVPVVAVAPAARDIDRLVKQLGDDDFLKREEASRRLREIGEPALDALGQAAASSDPEVHRRAGEIAEDIVTAVENKLYGAELLLAGHTDQVWSVSVSADGKGVLTASWDKTLRLWDADTGKQLRVFQGHTEGVMGAELSPDGKRVLSCGNDKTVRLWDAETGKELRRMAAGSDQERVAFGPAGKAISGGGSDGTMYLWDWNTGKNLGAFAGHTVSVRNVACSDRAKLAATCGNDRSIRLWDLETGKEVRRLPSGRSRTHFDTDLCFSPDGKRLLLACIDGSLRILDVQTGKQVQQIHSAKAFCCAFSPDGQRIVSGSCFDPYVRVWDAATGRELRKYEGHTAGVNGVAFFPDGKRIASAGSDGTAHIWRAPR
jgi:WD40 repeat protein